MKSLLYYLLQVIVASGILYGYYHLALRNKKFHHYNRFYLLAASVISITIPFLNIPVYFSPSETDSSFVLQTLTVISSGGGEVPTVTIAPETHINWFSWETLSFLFYILIASLVLIRIIFSLVKIRRIIKSNPVELLGRIQFVNTSEPGTPFSFFRWLFWNKKIDLQSEKGEQIFRHELFHIKQKHSWDIMYMELLTILLWINPFFHLIKKEVKAIHEFLADQFAVKENQLWEYAELLLMQVLNTKQQLVNPFFHNQIKRRIAMITTSKKPSHQYLRKLMVLPVAAVVIGLFAFSYKSKPDESGKNSFNTENILPAILDTTNPLKSVVLNGNITLSKIDTNPDKPSIVIVNGKEFRVNKLTVDGVDNVKIDSAEVYINTMATKDTINKPLIVLNGVKQPDNNKILRDLNPGIIEKVNVLKGPSAIIKYGDKGKNGVIEIITKKDSAIEIKAVTIQEMEADKTDNKIFTQVETRPSFPGGDTAWRHYLEKNANGRVPFDSGAPAGMYTVLVQFVVNIDGTISDVKAMTNHGFGMENEVIKIIKKGPKWIPATQNGKIVKAYTKQPVTFQVEQEAEKLPAKLQLKETGNGISQIQEISLAKLKKVTPLQLLQLSDGAAIVGYRFSIDISNKSDEIIFISDAGNRFNSAIKKQLNNATPGRLIVIDKIMIKKDSEEQKIAVKMYKVVD